MSIKSALKAAYNPPATKQEFFRRVAIVGSIQLVSYAVGYWAEGYFRRRCDAKIAAALAEPTDAQLDAWEAGREAYEEAKFEGKSITEAVEIGESVEAQFRALNGYGS